MKYLGSKARIFKHIAPLVLKDRTEGQYVVDLFAGGFNFIDKVEGNRIANELDEYIVGLAKHITQPDFSLPTIVKREHYDVIRLAFSKGSYEDNKDKLLFSGQQLPKWLIAFIGYHCSFGSKWFGGYAKNSKGTNYAIEGVKNIKKQGELLRGVKILNTSYENVEIPENSIVYCDPPYINTSGYKNSGDFDHEKFYNYCRSLAYKGNKVYISEYSMPDDFNIVWSRDVKMNLNKEDNTDIRVEKLYTI